MSWIVSNNSKSGSYSIQRATTRWSNTYLEWMPLNSQRSPKVTYDSRRKAKKEHSASWQIWHHLDGDASHRVTDSHIEQVNSERAINKPLITTFASSRTRTWEYSSAATVKKSNNNVYICSSHVVGNAVPHHTKQPPRRISIASQIHTRQLILNSIHL